MFLESVLSVLVIVLLFGLTIFVHELGHFLVARWCGLVIETFSIGFGPAVWQRKSGGIVYKIGCLPFGGYVALPQMDPTGESSKPEEGSGKAAPPPAAWWKRVLVSLAGASMNFALAVAIAAFVYARSGTVFSAQPTAVGYVETDTPAFKAGLRAGDRIAAVNGQTIRRWGEYAVACALTREASLDVVSPSGERRTLTVATDPFPIAGGRYLRGVSKYEPLQVIVVEPDTPAARGGLRRGDIITGADGAPVYSFEHLFDRLLGSGATGSVLTVRRDGQDLPLAVVPDVEKYSSCHITQVTRGMPAARAGLKAGDLVLEIEGRRISGSASLVREIATRGGVETRLKVEREGRVLELSVTPEFNPAMGEAKIGVTLESGGPLKLLGVEFSPYDMTLSTRDRLAEWTLPVFRVLKALVTPREAGRAFDSLSGPVGIFRMYWWAAQTSFLLALLFTGMLNVNLAILNLLPIPILDGGHIVLAVAEGITRRTPSPSLVGWLHRVFAALLIGLFLLITVRDIRYLLPGRGNGGAKTPEAVSTNAPPAAPAGTNAAPAR